LGALIACLRIHKFQYLKQIININAYLTKQPLYGEKTFTFWINSSNDANAPIDEILNLLVNSCPEMLTPAMPTLARNPMVVRNKEFNEYLRGKYGPKLMAVYGFTL
jgi:hypothetical protein